MPRSRSNSRSPKRHRSDNDVRALENYSGEDKGSHEQPDDSEECCTICLQPVSDRTVIPTCSHEFCFECLLLWTEQSRRCPLCSQNIGEYLIHSIRSRYDYRKRYLTPLRTSPAPLPSQNNALMLDMRQRTRRRRQERGWGTRESGAANESDKLERSISTRRWIYEHNLYAKHVGSNAYTKYRPYPTPAQFTASQDLISRTTTFLRRELQVWQGLDVEFLTTLIISLMKSIDIRSESAVKLISEFLDMDDSGGSRRNAEHFTHEVYSYVRSPYKDLFVYDTVVQYDSLPGVSAPSDLQRIRRWRHTADESSSLRDPSISPSGRRRSRSSARSSSRSPFRGHHQDRVGRKVSPSEVSEREAGPNLSEINPSHNTDQNQDRNNFEIRRDSYTRRSAPTSQRTLSPVATKGKGRIEPSRKLSSEDAMECSSSSHNINTHDDEGEMTTEPPERTLKVRPPRKQTLLETVKSHLSSRSAFSESHDFKPTRTGSRHTGAAHDTATPVLLARLSDPDPPSLLSQPPDPQTSSSIALPAPSGDGGQPWLEKSTIEARAKLLARLNREKTLHASDSEHAHSELPSHGSTDLETREANLKIRARLHTRLAAEKLVASVSEKS